MLNVLSSWIVLALYTASPTGAHQANVCSDFSFPVYFKAGSSSVAPTAQLAIAAAAKHFKRCKVASITVVGLSIPKGRKDLTEVRLHAVAAALSARGLTHPHPEIAAAVVARRRAMMANQAEIQIAMVHEGSTSQR